MFQIDKENRHFIVGSLIFLICYVLLAVIAKRPVFAFDIYWHLQMGKDLIEAGLSPWVDHYSVSYTGAEISPIPVYFQVLVYQFVSRFGEEAGFYYLKLFYITLLMSALYLYFRKVNTNSYIAFLLLPVIVSAVELRLLLRPEIFSNVLVVLCLVLYLKAQKKFAAKEMLFISLLLLFWVTYHAPVIGYIIIFGLFLEKAINKIFHNDESFSWSFWLLWGTIIFSIGFVNLGAPFYLGQHFVLKTIAAIAEGFGQYTREYKESYLVYSTNILVHVSWVLSIYVAIWSLVKRQYGFAFIAALLTYFSWSLMRLVTVVMLINMCILALYFSQAMYSEHSSKIRPLIKRLAYVISLGVAVLAFYLVGNDAYLSIKEQENKASVLEKRYPVQAADYLTNFQAGGNVLNVMQFGSYFINRLPSEYKIFFDGRTNILYPIEFVILNDHLWKDVSIMNKVIDNYDINYVLRENKPETFSRLQSNDKLTLSFADDNYIVFSDRKDNVFPNASKLLVFPACWNDSQAHSIRKEIELSEKLFAEKDYTLKYILAFLDEYLSQQDKAAFLENLRPETMRSDGVRRLALHLSQGVANESVVSDLFAAVQLKTNYDILIYAHYLAKTGQYVDAENLLFYYFTDAKNNKKVITFDKIAIMFRVLRTLQENNIILQHFDPSYQNELAEKLKKVNFDVDGELSFDYICK